MLQPPQGIECHFVRSRKDNFLFTVCIGLASLRSGNVAINSQFLKPLSKGKTNMFLARKISIWVIAAISIITSLATAQTYTTLNGPWQARDEKDIAINTAGTTLYAADKAFLFKSTNSGSSWATTAVERPSPLVVTCQPDNANVVVTGVTGYLYSSTDGGSTWSQSLIDATLTPLRLAVSPIAGATDNMYLGRQFVSGSKSLYYSSNGGAIWFVRDNFTYATSVNDIAPYLVSGVGHDQYVYAVGSDGTAEGTNQQASAVTRGVWWSADLGQTWSQKNMGAFNVKAIGV
ncbi:MAG: hypothetical protein HY277_09395, partial [Ignavibacteriales bacterium]|nr:hypothetical protein [Ignavibacteriales bacterium]